MKQYHSNLKWCSLTILMLFVAQVMLAQSRTITGKVTDAQSEPLAGKPLPLETRTTSASRWWMTWQTSKKWS